MQIEQRLSVQNKEIKVILEFPATADRRAEEELARFLKDLYWKKLQKTLAAQEGGSDA